MLCKIKTIYDIQISSHIHPPTQRILYQNATVSGQASGYNKLKIASKIPDD